MCQAAVGVGVGDVHCGQVRVFLGFSECVMCMCMCVLQRVGLWGACMHLCTMLCL